MNFQIFLKFSKIQYQNFLMVIFARDLVHVHSNLCLLDNIQAVNYAETTVEWEQWAVADADSE